MPAPKPSQFRQHFDYLCASNEWHAKLHKLADEVDKQLEESYGLYDGGDLCYNLVESGVIPEDATVDQAAAITAQHMAQA